jgi:L-seryl-tRNA(Ser) seleniumtransferase
MTASLLATAAQSSKAQLKQLPSVDRVLKLAATLPLIESHGLSFVTGEVRALLLEWRESLLHSERPRPIDDASIVTALSARIADRTTPRLKAVFNLTGTVLHTNMGRALLPDEAIAAIERTMRVPNNLEFDLATGERGDRDVLVEAILCELTGAEAATIVNNNAAAVLLTVAALAAKREVIVSRGELVEIGGSFRMPDVMKGAGARMVEVGTTNRTHARDYLGALSAKTALIMKVHTSNYVVQGFTAAVGESAIAEIAHRAGIPLAVDLGSGSLVDLAAYGLPHEPTPQASLAAGADIVTFSADKLLGGPQAGIIVGKAKWIAKLKKHPLKRALRVSKLTLAALEATLALYRHPETLAERMPTLRLLTRPLKEIEALAKRLAPALSLAVGERFEVACAVVQSQIGSGSLPIDVLPSAALAVRCSEPGKGTGRQLNALAAALRALPIPVIGRIAAAALILDLRTLEDEAAFVAQLTELKRRSVDR